MVNEVEALCGSNTAETLDLDTVIEGVLLGIVWERLRRLEGRVGAVAGDASAGGADATITAAGIVRDALREFVFGFEGLTTGGTDDFAEAGAGGAEGTAVLDVVGVSDFTDGVVDFSAEGSPWPRPRGFPLDAARPRPRDPPRPLLLAPLSSPRKAEPGSPFRPHPSVRAGRARGWLDEGVAIVYIVKSIMRRRNAIQKSFKKEDLSNVEPCIWCGFCLTGCNSGKKAAMGMRRGIRFFGKPRSW